MCVCLKDSALLLQVKSIPHYVEVNEARLITVCHTKQVNLLNSYIMAQGMSVFLLLPALELLIICEKLLNTCSHCLSC